MTTVIEEKLRKRVKKEVDDSFTAWSSLGYRTLKPEHHTVYICLDKFKGMETVSLTQLLNEMMSQRREAAYKARGDKEVADFIEKVDSMQSQIDSIYGELDD